MTPIRVAVSPVALDEIERAVRAGGGEPSDLASADAIVWVDPRDPAALAAALDGSPARWVQLPFAGIETFFEAGVVDPSRTWTCTKGAYGPATAEQALALMLAAARLLHRHARARSWWREGTGGHRRLAGTTAVVVGTGGIGSALAEMLRPLRVRVIGVNRSGRPVAWAERVAGASHLAEVTAEADWLIVAAPLTPATRGLVGKDVLAAMRPDAWLVNVARGGLVDTDALVAALRDERIGGAALDVTDPEPLPDDHPLWGFDNVIVTSHTANTREMAVPELAAMVERNVARFAAGEPLEGIVDPALGY